MDEKRRISLERADELYEEIEDYLAFKDEFLRETAERRDVLSKKHKEELLNYLMRTRMTGMTGTGSFGTG